MKDNFKSSKKMKRNNQIKNANKIINNPNKENNLNSKKSDTLLSSLQNKIKNINNKKYNLEESINKLSSVRQNEIKSSVFYSRIFIFVFIFLLVGTTFEASFASAQRFPSTTTSPTSRTSTFSGSSSFSSSTRFQSRASYQPSYSSEQIKTYWPILGDAETCQARQDILLNVRPLGCQPVVVRSDLLAEQDVPVFCQVDALNINPLLEIGQIRNVRFTGTYPAEVAGVGWHPAKAALRRNDLTLDAPLLNNIGYVVVVLKRQPDESKLPESVNLSLSAQLDYSAGNALGVGSNEFLLEETLSDTQWETQKLKQSFWKGRYFIRVDEANEDSADVTIYRGDNRISSARVQKGTTSREIYVPGGYCQVGLQVAYDGLVAAKKKARISLTHDGGTEVFDVSEGSRFFDDRCTITRITIGENSETGRITGSCKGKSFTLELKPRAAQLFEEFGGGEPQLQSSGSYTYANRDRETFRFENSQLSLRPSNGAEIILVKADGIFIGDLSKLKKDRSYYERLWSAMKTYNVDSSGIADYEIKNPKAKEYFEAAIENYERVVNEYGSLKKDNLGETYGEVAFEKAINLADIFGADRIKLRLINKKIELYPQTEAELNLELEELSKLDSRFAVDTFDFDGSIKTIRLLNLKSPAASSSAEFNVEGAQVNLGLTESTELRAGGELKGKIILEDLEKERASIRAFCVDRNGNLPRTGARHSFSLKGNAQTVCNVLMRLDNANIHEVARLRILPVSRGINTLTNFSVSVGIEKRAIKLAPDKTQDRIDELNKTIQKWEKITDKLGAVVTGLKTACFATSALLTFKNFMTGLSGETLARQEIMNGPNGWKSQCEALVPQKYPTLDACFIGEAGNIERDVSAYTNAISKTDQKVREIQNNYTTSVDIYGKSINEEALKRALAAEARAKYGTVRIDTSQLQDSEWKDRGIITVNDLLSPENIASVSVEEVRQIMLYSELQNSQLTPLQQENLKNKMSDIAKNVNEEKLIHEELAREQTYEQQGLAKPIVLGGESKITLMPVVRAGATLKSNYEGFEDNVTHSASVIDPKTGKAYILGLKEENSRGRVYSTKKIWEKDSKKLLSEQETAEFISRTKVGAVKSHDALSYSNEIAPVDRKVRYYETEPYRGMPAIVPFDVRNGWYAATRQTLPAFGGLGAFDASGRVTSFWVCNVGENKRIEFESGFGDDLCQQVNTQTGQPYGVFPGLGESQARNLITRAQRAIEDAARQYGNKFVTVGFPSERLEVGPPATGQPGTKCQDFMSPQDCHLLFNVCDPVICPSSRCNLGGAYPVANVVQTGIIGSALLCLPNIREGIAIPVCLTGIHAGIQAFTSILKNHRDCLQEHLETGQMVGICDEIYSIYLCEFFWGQIAPFVNILIPKIIEIAYGQGTRGGGEYLTVMSAWQNMENSINYFTQSYAQNSFTAFQARSGVAADSVYGTGVITELGAQFCKGFVSAKAPNAFKSLVEPDSPPQFHAWFDSKTLTSATVPATAQYKVFYHIFGGNDQGVGFQVYLKNPPQSSYFGIAQRISVASGYIPRGEYASETRDFTAPEGYQELCVNINGEEKCGFKQVSTSFAVNYLRDISVNSELQNRRVTSEKECVSGAPNPGALLQPNLQSGVEEIVSPEIYNRGVVRICATQNPGTGTDPGRFINVGYCDDQKIGCWLDKRSVDKALSESNIGLKNEALSVLEQRAREFELMQVLGEDETIAEIGKIRENLNKLETNDPQIENKAIDILNQINNVYKSSIFDKHKAELILLAAETNEKVAIYFKNFEDERSGIEGIVGPPLPDEVIITSTANERGYYNLIIKNEPSLYYVKEGILYSVGPPPLDYVEIGKVNQNGEITLFEDDKIKDYISSTDKKLLHGAKIRGYSTGEQAPPTTQPTQSSEELKIIYYSLGKEEEDRRNILLDGEPTGIYLEGNEFFSNANGIKIKLGQMRIENDLRVIKKNELEYQDLSKLDSKIKEHWNFLLDKNFDELLAGELSVSAEKVECKLSNARWVNELGDEIKSVNEKQFVNLQVEVNQVCVGKELEFVIREDDIFPFPDEQIGFPIIKNVEEAGRINFEWNAPAAEDIFGLPEYYFVVSLTGDSDISDKSENLKVQKAVSETPSPTTPTTQPEVEERSYNTKYEYPYEYRIYLGESKTEIYMNYPDREVIKALDKSTEEYVRVGTRNIQSGRINILDFSNLDLSEETKCHLRNLNGKFYRNNNFYEGSSGDEEVKEDKTCPIPTATDVEP